MARRITAPHPSAHFAPHADPAERIVVLSDLHMGPGARADGSADPLEHFFHDAELAVLIERLAQRCARRAQRCCLVLNGDVFDFVRTVRLPEGAAAVAAWRALLREADVEAPAGALEDAAQGRFTAVERRYGMDATEPESVWKLLAISQGHPRVFEALAHWCEQGHELVVVRGNHDVEWAWPGVRRALRVLLERCGGRLRPGQLRFRMHGFRAHNVHVQHGQTIRWSTNVEGRFAGGVRRRLKQPFGSFVNRFVLNPVERLAPHPPGVPATVHMKRQLRREPFRLWRSLLRHAFRAMPALGRDAWRTWNRRAHRLWPTHLGNALGLTVLALPLLAPDLVAVLALDSLHTRAGAALLALATPHLGLALLETLGTVRDDTRRRARAHARRLAAHRRAHGRPGDRVVILGHTHRPELVTWRCGAVRVVYANPGCWMGEDESTHARPRFVWCAWDGRAYGRTRVLELNGESGRCRTHSRS